MEVLLERLSRGCTSLKFREPGLKPGKSTWSYFREAEGLAEAQKLAVLVYKAERGQADLPFGNTSAESLGRAAEKHLEPDIR